MEESLQFMFDWPDGPEDGQPDPLDVARVVGSDLSFLGGKRLYPEGCRLSLAEWLGVFEAGVFEYVPLDRQREAGEQFAHLYAVVRAGVQEQMEEAKKDGEELMESTTPNTLGSGGAHV